jgi:hypothetical protein
MKLAVKEIRGKNTNDISFYQEASVREMRIIKCYLIPIENKLQNTSFLYCNCIAIYSWLISMFSMSFKEEFLELNLEASVLILTPSHPIFVMLENLLVFSKPMII